jgi:predicted nucleic acid-binding protein
MPPSEIYVCDANCLINLHHHFGRKAIRALRDWSKKGVLKLPEGVVRELIHATDNLARFAEKERQHLEIAARQFPALHTEIPRLERLYGKTIRVGTQQHAGFWHSKAGRRAADAQVVAVAKLLKGGVAVSDDAAVKLACALEGVPCIGWSELARRLGLIKPQQLDLNLGSGATSGG